LFADVVVAGSPLNSRQGPAALACCGQLIQPQLPATAQSAVELDHAVGDVAHVVVELDLFVHLISFDDKNSIEVGGALPVLNRHQLGESRGSLDGHLLYRLRLRWI